MTDTPNTPAELLALQGALSDNARKVLNLCVKLNLDIPDTLAVAIELTQCLLGEHASAATTLFSDPEADRHQLHAWIADTERLALALGLLRSVDPPTMEEQ